MEITSTTIIKYYNIINMHFFGNITNIQNESNEHWLMVIDGIFMGIV